MVAGLLTVCLCNESHQNALRHNYAAYWLAEHGDLNALARQMGHISGLTTLRRHYYRAVSKSDAGEFWDIVPSVGAASDASEPSSS